MTATEWHVDERTWQAYAAGRLDEIAEASIDAHVTGCEICRGMARAVVHPAGMDALWRGIEAEVRRPRLPWTLRWLRRFGVPEDDLVILSASDGFALPWAMAVGSALLCATITAMTTVHQHGTFLFLAPLVPVLAVVAAFDATDVLRALVTTTPYSKLRLALLRTTATVSVALPSTLAIGVVIPGLEPLAFSWQLPALALTTAVLVLLTWLGPWTSAGAVMATWALVVLPSWRSDDVSHLTGPVAQLAYVALATLLLGALVIRTTSYRPLGGAH